MNACTLKDWLHSLFVGFGLAVVLMAILYGSVMITWAANESILPTASKPTDQRMAESSAILAAGSVGLPENH